MASTSASSIQKRFKYDVFLSFRGEDTRKNFVDHLYHALQQKGITTYKDDEKIKKGERISDQLLRSIEESRFYIIVFSKNYASSSWCLDELVKIMECQKTKEHVAYPIFYDVEPTEVRHQSGAVGKAFAKHVRRSWSSVLVSPLYHTFIYCKTLLQRIFFFVELFTIDQEDDVGRWRSALKEATNLAGMELKNTADGIESSTKHSHEARFIQKVIEEISSKLYFTNLNFEKNLVGMLIRAKKLVSSLEIGFDDVRMIGIKGKGGGGKTTLARAVFDHMAIPFEGKSFVENVREVSKVSGLQKLQNQVLQDVLNDKSINVTCVSEGKHMMRRTMGNRKVLVVLDDVDHLDQLEALASNLNWFKTGSRIIITTRDEHVLIAHGVHSENIHDVSLLSPEEAICLFSRYAFMREIPCQGYEELSVKVVHYAAGLPLTIKVLASFLKGRSEREWKDAIERLQTIPLKGTLEKLKLSYNGLENDYKEIFLEVACILKGKHKHAAIRVLESCGFRAEIGLRVLEQKSLITISDGNILQMHDHIEEMGMNIVRCNDHNRHSRLWIKEEIEDILVNDLGTEATRSIKLEHSELHPATIMKGLRKMKELRSLYVFGRIEGEVDEVRQYLPNTLRSLDWPYYPFGCLPITFGASNLVNLRMGCSEISELWEGGENKVLSKLRFLDLQYSKLRTFDLSMAPNLEMLNLQGYNSDFVELKMPHECPKLEVLNLSGSKVSNIDLGRTPNLVNLNLGYCYSLEEIHAPVGCLKKLVYLNLNRCLRFQAFDFPERHESPGRDSCYNLQLTAESPGICPLHPHSTLPKFQFKCSYDEGLPSLTGNIEKLLSFGLCACTDLESFSTIICSLQHLRSLALIGNIREAPKDLGQLESLEELTLSMRYIKHVPDSICLLKNLKSLKLSLCGLLEELPMDLGRLESLEVLELMGCISLRSIPNSVCELKYLKTLCLYKCILVEKLPEELGSLERLRFLTIKDAGVVNLPESILLRNDLLIIGRRSS